MALVAATRRRTPRLRDAKASCRRPHAAATPPNARFARVGPRGRIGRGVWKSATVQNCSNPNSRPAERHDEENAHNGRESCAQIARAQTPESAERSLLDLWKEAREEHQQGAIKVQPSVWVLSNAWAMVEALLGVMIWDFCSRKARLAAADLVAWMCGDTRCDRVAPVELLRHLGRLLRAGHSSAPEFAMRAVRNLVRRSPEYCQALHESGLLGDMLQASNGYQTEEALLNLYSAETLLSLVHHYCKSLDELRTIAAVANRPLAMTLRLSDDPRLVRCAAECVCELSADCEVCGNFVELGLHQFFGSVMQSSTNGLQKTAVKMLGRVIGMQKGTGNVTVLLEERAVEVLLDLAIYKGEPEDVVYGALTVLLCIVARGGETIKTSSKEQVFGMCSVVAQGSFRCRVAATELLFLVSKEMEVMRACAQQVPGFLCSLFDLLESTPAALELLALASQDVKNPEVLSRQVGTCGFRKLLDKLDSKDQDHVEMAYRLLVQITMSEEGCVRVANSGILPQLIRHFCDTLASGNHTRNIVMNILKWKSVDTVGAVLEAGVVDECSNFLAQRLPGEANFSALPEDEQKQALKVVSAIVMELARLPQGAAVLSQSNIFGALANILRSECLEHRALICTCLTLLLAPPCQRRTSKAIIRAGYMPTVTRMLHGGLESDRSLAMSVLRRMAFRECSEQIVQSDLIGQICAVLQDPKSRMSRDALLVLCRLSRILLHEVCAKIRGLGAARAVWAASSMLPPGGPLNKPLWQMYQHVHAMELKERGVFLKQKILQFETELEEDRLRCIGTENQQGHGEEELHSGSFESVGSSTGPVDLTTGVRVRGISTSSHLIPAVLEPTESISHLKPRKEEIKGRSAQSQSVFYSGEDRDNQKACSYYELKDGSILSPALQPEAVTH